MTKPEAVLHVVFKPKRAKLQIFILIILFFLLTFLSSTKLLPVPDMVFILLAGLYALLASQNFFHPLMMFMIPVSLWIPMNEIIAIMLVIYVLRFYDRIMPCVSLFWCTLLVLVSGISLLDGVSSLLIYCKGAIVLMALVFFFFAHPTDLSDVLTMRIYCMSFFLCAAITITIALRYSDLTFILTQGRLGYTSISLFLPDYIVMPNENDLGVLAILAACVLNLIRRKQERTRSNSLCYYFELLICITIGLLTKSRTFLVLLAVFISLLLIDAIKRPVQALKIFLSLTAAGAMILFLINRYFPNLITSILYRFTYSDLSNGRIDIFKQINEVFFTRIDWIIFGVGTQANYIEKLNLTTGFHNGFQELYVSYGILGCILALMLFYSCARACTGGTLHAIPLRAYFPLGLLLVSNLATGFDMPLFLICLYALRLGCKSQFWRILQ